MKIKTVVVEDDKDTLERLSSILTDCFSEIAVVGSAGTKDEALTLLSSAQPQLAVLDIELKNGSAFEVLDELNTEGLDIVFVTAYNKYLQLAMQHYAFYYLLKPFHDLEFVKVIRRYLDDIKRKQSLLRPRYFELQEFLKEQAPKLLINTGKQHVFLVLRNIVKCTASGNYTYFELNNSKKYLGNNTLKHYTEILEYRGFFRVNRQVLVNLDYVETIYKRQALILHNGERLHISSGNRERLHEVIRQFSQ
ncbi:LytTR family DNA-binding domain-containing protein [Flavobacteriaceae bacterium GF1]